EPLVRRAAGLVGQRWRNRQLEAQHSEQRHERECAESDRHIARPCEEQGSYLRAPIRSASRNKHPHLHLRALSENTAQPRNTSQCSFSELLITTLGSFIGQ